MQATPSPCSVLLVDDDEINNFIARKLINKVVPNTLITTALNGKLALEHLIETKSSCPQKLPSHIFLDINMPVMDAWSFLEEFKDNKINTEHDIQIFIISSSVFSHDIQRAKSYNCVSDFITKPLSVEKIKKIFDFNSDRDN
ncbi:MAG: response regulator [Sphingobacteriaceae bacterium]